MRTYRSSRLNRANEGGISNATLTVSFRLSIVASLWLAFSAYLFAFFTWLCIASRQVATNVAQLDRIQRVVQCVHVCSLIGLFRARNFFILRRHKPNAFGSPEDWKIRGTPSQCRHTHETHHKARMSTKTQKRGGKNKSMSNIVLGRSVAAIYPISESSANKASCVPPMVAHPPIRASDRIQTGAGS